MIHKCFDNTLRLCYYIFTNFVLGDNVIITWKHNNNNLIKFFIIYVLSQQLYGQLHTQHSVPISNYIVEQYNIEPKENYRQAMEKIHINTQT
jgi:hypothetical protein